METALKVEYPPKLILSLLRKTRRKEALWNLKHPQYPKKVLKRNIWDRICRELKDEYPQFAEHITTDGVMSKFTYLRGNYQKLLKKIEQAQQVSGKTITPKWEYFHACSFLAPVYSTSFNENSFGMPDLGYEAQKYGLLDMKSGEVEAAAAAAHAELSPSSAHSSPPGSPGRPRKRRYRNRKDEILHDTAMETLNAIQTVLRDKGECEEYLNTEEYCAVSNVRTLMRTIPDSDRNLRVEFNKELLRMISSTYDKFYNG